MMFLTFPAKFDSVSHLGGTDFEDMKGSPSAGEIWHCEAICIHMRKGQ